MSSATKRPLIPSSPTSGFNPPADATDGTIQRLIAAGLISRTTRATRPLFPAGPDGDTPTLSPNERAKADALRDRAARKIKMARVLGDGGFDEEARSALLEGTLALGGALAVEHRLPEPPGVLEVFQPPISHLWREALPTLKQFAENPGAPWKPVADCLAKP